MAKKQTRRSISVSKFTYERLKAYCETNGISMSHFVEERVGDFLGRNRPGRPPARPLAVDEGEERDDRPSAPPLSADHIFTF